MCQTGKESENTSLTVNVYSDFDDIDISQTEWDDFIERCGGDLFLTYDWCRIWWKYYGSGKRKLHIFMFRSKDSLVAILPLFSERLWLGPVFLDAIKIVGSDFTLVQFSLPIQKEFMPEVLKVLFDRLTDIKWDIIHLGQCAGRYADYDHLVTCLKQRLERRHYIVPKKRGEQIYFELADSWDSYLSNLNSHGRNNIKRNYKKLHRHFSNTSGELNFIEAKSNDLHVEMENFIKLHQIYWQKRGKPGHFLEWPESTEFHKEMSQVQNRYNRVRLMRCSWANYKLSYEYGYKYGSNHFIIWNSRLSNEEFQKLPVGIVSTCELIKYATLQNCKYIDSLRGHFQYKINLGGKIYPIRTIYICRKKMSTVLRGLTFRCIARSIHMVYFKYWRKKICPKIKRFTPLWRVWIKTHMFS